MKYNKNQITKQLQKVRTLMVDSLRKTEISRLLPPNNNIVGSGKMLRAQLTLFLSAANGVDERVALHAAGAIEIVHGASLLHDDVIDGGVLRRNAPTFWKKHGINGTILLGDLLVFKGLELLINVSRLDLLEELICLSAAVCQSEVEQELLLRGKTGTWAECEKIARAKTGSLFAFAAVAAAQNPEQADALREAGFVLGTAYQLADDLLDASGNEVVSGKTLGKDLERGKTTAKTVTKDAPADPIAYIHLLLDRSAQHLTPWATLHEAWLNGLDTIFLPVFKKHLST